MKQRKTKKKINETKNEFFERPNKIRKLLAGKKYPEKSQITKIRNEGGDIPTKLTELKTKIL